MIFLFDPTTAANTTEENAVITRKKVTKGLIYQIDVFFPPGSSGLLKAALFDGKFQIAPSHFRSYFSGDNVKFTFQDLYIKEREPYELQLITYNEDNTFNHLVNVYVSMTSKEEYKARYLPMMANEAFKKMIEDLLKSQMQRRSEVLEHPFEWVPKE